MCRIYGELPPNIIRDGKILCRQSGRSDQSMFFALLQVPPVEGVYQHRTWLALLIAVIIIAFNYWLMVYVSQRQFDITER